jgi:uncharacterized protein
MGLVIEAVSGGVRIPVHAQPRASRSELAGERGGALRVRLAAPPVDGEANEELLRLLARALGRPRSAARITAGAHGRRKVVEIEGVDVAAARRLLGLD